MHEALYAMHFFSFTPYALPSLFSLYPLSFTLSSPPPLTPDASLLVDGCNPVKPRAVWRDP